MSNRPAVLQGMGQYAPLNFDLSQRAAEMQQHERMQSANLRQRQAENAQDQDWRRRQANQKLIDELKVGQTGVNTIDTYNNEQLGKLQQKLIDLDMQGANYADLKLAAAPEWSKIMMGYTMGKNHEANIDKGIQELGTQYPGANPTALKQMANDQLLKDVFDFDESGNVIGYKESYAIPKEKDYIKPLTDFSMLDLWNNPSGALDKSIQERKPTDYSQKEFTGKKDGHRYKNNAIVKATEFFEPIEDENGKRIGIKVKAEEEVLGVDANGNRQVVQVMPEEQYQSFIASQGSQADWARMINPQLRAADQFIKSQGGEGLSPKAAEVMKRKFALDYIQKGADQSQFVTDVADIAPKPPSIRVSVGGNSSKSDVDWNDVYKEISDKIDEFEADKRGSSISMSDLGTIARDTVMKTVDDPEVKSEDVYILRKDGKTFLMKRSDNSQIAVLSKKDTNVQGNTPLGVKAKQKALENSQSAPKPKDKPKNDPLGLF